MNNHVAILGLGLIGGSLAKALKAASPGYIITGIDPDTQAHDILQEDDTLDHAHTTLSNQALQGVETLIIATPPHSWEAIAATLNALSLETLTLIMDVGSVKHYALECFGALPQFVPAHPIAGSEFSGAAFSTEALFTGKRVILTPADESNERLITDAIRFWEMLDVSPTLLDAAAHDNIYANMSHLPQLSAYAIALATLGNVPHNEAYKGFLRLAGSSPELWLGIFRHNPSLANAAETYLQILSHMLAELRTGELDNATPLNMDVAAQLAPRILASCLISTATLEERKQDINMASFAGSGFADMSAPAMSPPDDDLALISEHSNAVIALLEMVEQQFRAMLVAVKTNDWEGLRVMIQDAQTLYVKQLH